MKWLDSRSMTFVGFFWEVSSVPNTVCLYARIRFNKSGFIGQRYLGHVKRFYNPPHDQWNAYGNPYNLKGGKDKGYMFTAKTLDEIKAAFEVAMRLE